MSDDPATGDDLKVVRLNDIREKVEAAKPRAKKKPGEPPRRYEPPPTYLPPDCPVKPLGHEGVVYHFLAADGQRISFTAEKIGRNNILALFGGEDYLIRTWPATDSKGFPNGEWKHGRLSPVLIQSCQRAGMWNPADKERGVGCWLEGESTLVFHCGDILVTSQGRAGTGVRGRLLYPAAPKLPEPILNARPSLGAEKAMATWAARDWAEIHGPGARVMERLVTWNFARPLVDPILILGFICCAMLGAAPEWRPMLMLTGDTRTGKSTLLKGLKAIIGQDALVSSGNTTQAAIARKVGNTSKPVFLDEMERGAGDSDHRSDGIMDLVILASSGETLDRGTPGTETHSFQARNCFAISAINLPGMKPQLMNRCFVIELGLLDSAPQTEGDSGDAVEEVWGPRGQLERIGSELRGRLLVEWPRYKQTMVAYHNALRRVGHDRRSADQFGTALAAYDLVMFEQFDAERAATYAAMVPAATTAETSGTRSLQQQCADYLLEQRTALVKGGRQFTIAKLIEKSKADQELNQGEDVSESRAALMQVGIKLYRDKRFGGTDGNTKPFWMVAIASDHAGTAGLFAGTPWHKKAGSSSGHYEMLRRLPGAETHDPDTGKKRRLRFDGRLAYVVLVPHETLFPPEGGDESSVMYWRDE